MDIKHENGEIRGVFKAEENGVGLGLMTYTWAGDTRFIIDHTEVFPENEGKGVGKEMVMAAVEYARANNLKIIPLCPFAKAMFAKNSEIRDVL